MPLTILYGSQTGTAERQAFRIARMALQRGEAAVRCLPADDTAPAEWPSYCAQGGHVILVLANANQGEAPETYRRSWVQLLSPDAPSMEGLTYAVFGLGDSLYAKFNYMAKMTHNRLRQLGGVPLLLRGLGDESDAQGLDEALLPWLTELWVALGYTSGSDASLAAQPPPPQGPLDAKFFPLYHVEVGAGGKDACGGPSDAAPASCPPARREPTFPCTVVENMRLTAANHFQAVHHIDFEGDSDKLTYEVGDALGVYCANSREHVDYMLDFCQLSSEAMLTISPRTSDGLVEQTHQPFFDKPVTARNFFTHHVDLEAVTEQDFFWMMSFFVEGRTDAGEWAGPAAETAPDGTQTLSQEYRDRLRELADPTNPDDFLVYAHREKRNVVEVLRDHNVGHEVRVRPPLAFLLSFLTPMRPRLFSFSSCPTPLAVPKDTLAAPRRRVSLTVARLEWETPMGRQRHGMCSTALTHAQPGDVFECVVWQGSLAVPPTPAPLLLVATGTGIAPMRALLHHCAAHAADGWAATPILLFFGCRDAAKDYLYGAEWERLRKDGLLAGLTVVPAFSRADPASKVYVQNQLGRHATRVGALLLGEATPSGADGSTDAGAHVHSDAVIYVCGNAKSMPKDVQAVLQDIIDQVCCRGDEAGGRAFMKRLQQEGRYQVDTWSA